jgi:hypothetical protein
MNVLIYKLNDPEIVERLVEQNDANLYFAISEEDIFRIAKEIKPELMIIGNKQFIERKIFYNFIKQNPALHIYCFEKASQFNEIRLTDQLTMKEVNFKTILN